MKATFAQLRAFNAVAKAGSFVKASKKLGVTQPAVTLQVRGLEDLYSIVLFVRYRHRAVLTSIGSELYEATQSMELVENEVDDVLNRQSQLLAGQLTLGAGSPLLVMPLIKEFNKKYPNVEITLELGDYNKLEAAILENSLDIGILDGLIANERLLSTKYLDQELILIVSKDHPLTNRKKIYPDDLVNETIVLRGVGSFTRKTTEAWFHSSKIELKSRLIFNNRDSILEAVARGMGVGFIFKEEAGDDARVKKIRLFGKTTRCNENIVCLKSQIRRSTIKAFFDLIPKKI